MHVVGVDLYHPKYVIILITIATGRMMVSQDYVQETIVV